ncbi:MAG: MerR family transcriptional regulator [Alphaproteobacteria bacterium]|nr:MerR family transcriptional regulator [Alphaproteobacteria bacterium]MDE2495639.1 MerR family transcriptional regulator [Alphaproteobacteria bacterium]
MPEYKIGDLAKHASTTAPTIRYYEEAGLLPRANRQQGGQRRYSEKDLDRLIFVRRCREFGVSVKDVRALAAISQSMDRSCYEARELVRAHLQAIRARLRELKALERGFARFLRDAETECPGGAGPDCTVVKELKKPYKRSDIPNGRRKPPRVK